MSDVNSVITYLKKVCSIPRASGDERRISNYIADFARERGLEVLQDEYYNLIIKAGHCRKCRRAADPSGTSGHGICKGK